MRRVVSVFLPTWPTDRWRRRHGGPPRDKPLVTVATDGPRRVVAAACRAAHRLGLAPGMPVAQAQGMIVDLALVEASPEADAEGLARLAAWCLTYAPLVASDPPDGIWIEIAGAAHLLGGEARLIEDLTRRIRGGGFSVRAAVADTPGAAWAAARFLRGNLVLGSGEQAAALAALPVRALRLAPGIVEGLTALGLERIGQLAETPRAPLRRRFGELAAIRLDQALGHEPEPLAYLKPPETHTARISFSEPIGAPETLARTVERLSGTLCADLERHGLGARRLDLVCQRVDGQPQSLRIGTARPTRDPRHVAGLFAERLGLIDPGFGIEAALLRASRVERASAHQLTGSLDAGTQADPAAMAALVDRLSLRLGKSRLYRVAPVESEWPERATRRVAPLSPATGANWPADLPRPARLLDPPEPVQVIAALPDNPPAWFVWRRDRRRVVQADGPERVHGEWWRSDDEIAAVRDYYRVEDASGARFWLFRDAPADRGGRWWLHGLGEA